MLKRTFILLWAALILIFSHTAMGIDEADDDRLQGPDLSRMEFERIAVMPFLIGKLESTDHPVEKPLSLALQQLNPGAANLSEGADQSMTRLVHHYLKVRYPHQLIPEEAAGAVHADVIRDPLLDTPRKLAVQFGKHLQADLVVMGVIWQFREKGADKEIPDNLASVAFAVYLVEVDSGKRLWRNAFDGTQKILSEDLLGGLKQAKVGFRWISATELARLGVKQVFKKFPL